MNIVAVINYKGGVGKTTVTSNLAAELAYRGKKVLLIDTDAQASLTFSFITPEQWDAEYKSTRTIKSWFDAISQGFDQPTLTQFIITPPHANRWVKGNGGKIDLICSHLGLLNVDLELATLLGGVNLQQSKRNYIKVHSKLQTAIEELSTTAGYDIVLIDCPPNFNIVTKNAIVASEEILIPAKPDYLSTLGIDYLQRSVNELVQEFNEYADLDATVNQINPKILGVVFTMIQINGGKPIGVQRQYISQTQRLGVKTFEKFFRENKTVFSDAPRNLVPAVLNYYSQGTYSDVVGEIEAFVDEFISAIERESPICFAR